MDVRWRSALAALVASLVVSACKDGGPSEPGGGDEWTDAPVGAEERRAALAAMETTIEALTGSGVEGDSLNRALASWLETRPEFEAAGVDSTSSVWARFRDGRLLIVANNRDPEPVSDSLRALAGVEPASAPRPREAPAPRLQAGAERTELPAEDRVRLLHSFGADFDQVQAPIDDMSGWFVDHGYEIVPGAEGDARVETLRNVAGDGFLYLNTHGGKGKTREGHDIYALQTSSMVDAAKDAIPEFRDDLDAGRLVYMTASNGGTTALGLPDWDTRYAITYRFVEEYMSFGENSIVFVNACYSANSNSDISSFIFAMHQKGADVYLGWTKVVSADAAFEAVRYFVDRLLGANEYRPEDPEQRPFAWPEVLEEMRAKGISLDEGTGAELLGKPAAAAGRGAGVLSPSIMLLAPDGLNDELYITGIFGERPESGGTVTIDDGSGPVALSVLDWTPTLIITSLPRTGPGSVGDVVVHVREHRSNARRLHRVEGALRYTWEDAGTLSRAVEMDVDVRLDPAPIRQKPGQKPFRPAGTAMGWSEPAAVARYASTGMYRTANGDCTYTTTWHGSGEFPATTTGGGGGYEAFAIQLWLDTGAQRMEIRPVASAPYTDRFEVACDGGTTVDENPLGFTIDTAVLDEPGTLFLPTDGAMAVAAGRRERSVPSNFENTASVVLEWTAMRPVPAYDPTQRR